MLISVIIPVFNKISTIKETLDSVLNQSIADYEVILVNDGSTDGSFDILRKYCFNYPEKIHLINSVNQGVSAATNLGIRAAKGEYIQFLDADDLLDSDKIAEQIKILKGESNFVIATCEWCIFKKDLKDSFSIPFGVFQDFDSGLDLLLRFWNYQEMFQPASYLSHRDLIFKAGLWDESLTINQDGEFFTRVLLHAKKVIFEPSGKVFYRTPGVGNVSQQKSESAMASLLKSYQAFERAVLPVEDSPRVRIALKKVYQKFIYDVFPRYPNLIEKAETLMDNLGVNEATYIGGPKFQQLSRLLGFKNALRLKRILNS